MVVVGLMHGLQLVRLMHGRACMCMCMCMPGTQLAALKTESGHSFGSCSSLGSCCLLSSTEQPANHRLLFPCTSTMRIAGPPRRGRGASGATTWATCCCGA